MSRLYQDAVKCLRARLRPLHSSINTNYEIVPTMKRWLAELECKNTSALNVIHITGTKGKGSTAAYTDSFIRAHSRRLARPIKVGLYTSPHLMTERERIRINAQPISEELFAAAFLEIWDMLRRANAPGMMPGYLQLLALQSIFVFKREAVDVAIYEVHAGGKKDATNVFDQPVACGFTTIGLDHVDLLGGSIESIAEQKSGIMKHGRPAFSTVQNVAAVKSTLEREAKKLNSALEFVDISPELPSQHPALASRVQKQNTSLAIQLANTYLARRGDRLTRGDIIEGISTCKWPGRFQIVDKSNSRWFLDCAHNSLSIPVVLSWFMSKTRASTQRRALIFGHESARNTHDLISLIAQLCSKEAFHFDMVILTPYERYGEIIHDSAIVEDHARFWRAIQPSTRLESAHSVEEALDMAEGYGSQTQNQILVTGSTHLVGQTLAVLEDKRDTNLSDARVGYETRAAEGVYA